MSVRLAGAVVTQTSPLLIIMNGDPRQTPIAALPKVYTGSAGDQVSVRALRSGRKPQVVALVRAANA